MNFKRLLLFTIILGYCLTASAQFKLSGKILNNTGKEELQINIPLVFGFHKENSFSIPIAKDGSFSILLPIKETKFANLIYKRTFHSLLLNVHKNLVVHLKDTNVTLVSGTALAENRLMQKIDLEEYPFFLMEERNKEFASLSLMALKTKLLEPYFAQRDQKIKLVNASQILKKYKLLINTELKSITYNYINDFARTQLSNRGTVDSLILSVFNDAELIPEIYPAGPQYFAFVDNYIRFLETKAFNKIKAEKIPANEPLPYFGITLDSANIIVKKYDKNYWRWIGVTKNFPLNIVEKYTFQQLTNLYNEKDIRPLEGLTIAYQQQFPKSTYYKQIDANVSNLKKLLIENETNKRIKILENFQNISTMQGIINSFKGKVVYLDIWGTWCGPCKDELTYVPQLKAKFKDKDVVFVYLDMDEESQDGPWRDFIKVNNMEGIHLRKNRQTIDPFWKELLANAQDKSEYYPQYFIFDKEGKLVVSKAKRPSEKEALYTQLAQYLK